MTKAFEILVLVLLIAAVYQPTFKEAGFLPRGTVLFLASALLLGTAAFPEVMREIFVNIASEQLGLVLAFFGYKAFSNKASNSPKKPPPKIQTQKPESRDVG